MILVIGEVLFDIFPSYKRIGGAPFNFAYHVNSLQIPTRLITRIGADQEGDLARERLAVFPHGDRDTQLDSSHPTGRVTVVLDKQGNPDYDILENMAYDFIKYDENVKNILDRKPQLIYFGSLIQRGDQGFRTVQRILGERDRSSKCLYDVNLRTGCYSDKIIRRSLEHTDILKLNQGELEIIREMFGFRGDNQDFISYLIDTYSLEMISLTRGADGSTLITPEGVFNTPGPGNIRIVDTVGAGDAYSAIIALGFVRGWNPARTLELATRFSAAVCGLQGAIPEDRSFYSAFS
jgi:fructokinase